MVQEIKTNKIEETEKIINRSLTHLKLFLIAFLDFLILGKKRKKYDK